MRCPVRGCPADLSRDRANGGDPDALLLGCNGPDFGGTVCHVFTDEDLAMDRPWPAYTYDRSTRRHTLCVSTTTQKDHP